MNKQNEKELDILFPNREISVGDRIVNVCEFTAKQGLSLVRLVKPMVDQLVAEIRETEDVSLDVIELVFSENIDAYFSMLEISTGEPVTFLENLTDSDGQLLMLAFWEVNKDFFLQRLVSKIAMEMNQHMATLSVGEKSLTH